MKYDIQFKLPSPWTSESETYLDESGTEITHLECHLPDDRRQTDDGYIDIYVGEMPEDTTAADEALANYADIVGFDDDDPEDFDPITEWPFGGRKAYGFEALCEDDSPIRVMCFEPKKGVLCIMSIIAPSDGKLVELVTLVERTLRIRNA